MLSGLIIANDAYTQPNAIELKKGDVAPFAGVELSDSYAKEVYKELNDLDKYKLLTQSLQQSINLYEQNEVLYKSEITDLKTQNTSLDTALQKANTNSFWVKALWFVAGMIVIGAADYVARRN